MQQWEYLEASVDLDKKSWKDSAGRTRKLKKRATIDVLNELGGEGWELAGALPVLDSSGHSRLYFKRPVAGESQPADEAEAGVVGPEHPGAETVSV